MKCNTCQNERYCYDDNHQLTRDYCADNGFVAFTPITNADRIRAMTDEELAVQIAWPYVASPPWCVEHITCPYISEDPTPCDKCVLDWLKSPVEVDNG